MAHTVQRGKWREGIQRSDFGSNWAMALLKEWFISGAYRFSIANGKSPSPLGCGSQAGRHMGTTELCTLVAQCELPAAAAAAAFSC